METSLSSIDVLIILIYFSLIILIGIWISRKTKSGDDLFLGGRSLTWGVIGLSLFASNILFWLESGYFETAGEFKPLFHTWSLALEEQYYVLFPLFLMLFWVLGKRFILNILIFIYGILILLNLMLNYQILIHLMLVIKKFQIKKKYTKLNLVFF